MLEPIRLPANQPPARFYRGGERIAAFRGDPPAAPNTPEDWVGSTTGVRGHAPIGLTRLPDGTILADAVAADPAGWLGADHLAAFGVDTKLLVKLLDPGQRLPIHAHPHHDFAADHLGETHGKAEAWYILAPGTVYLGLRDDLDPAALADLVATQQTERMLSLMHEVPVFAGDSVYVPPGVLHAIGEGVLLAEVQEPTDLSILLEWQGFDVDGSLDGHLDLGFDLALQAVETEGRSADAVAGLIVRAAGEGSALVVVTRRTTSSRLSTLGRERVRLADETSSTGLSARIRSLIRNLNHCTSAERRRCSVAGDMARRVRSAK